MPTRLVPAAAAPDTSAGTLSSDEAQTLPARNSRLRMAAPGQLQCMHVTWCLHC
ncbi:hypothetical protein XMIN_462 [Xanthomonas citri pv. mangiferaeindicae LMG 941]|nr:hypothetical protein XMIN_462 [Xanthomonas citri pv. mangiferaeindicae LMG 941]